MGESKPRLLDLMCCEGGGARGYQRAGFHVTGVDKDPQPNYAGDEFIQADALEFLDHLLDEQPWGLTCFDAAHGSPPCQWASALNRAVGNQDAHENLIPPTRARLLASGLPYVIENVPEARSELHDPALICGASVGLQVVRHRLFETNWPLMVPTCAHKHGGAADGTYVMFGGRSPRADGRRVPPRASEREWRDEAGLDFLTIRGARQAIPPAMTELIGYQLMTYLRNRKREAA